MPNVTDRSPKAIQNESNLTHFSHSLTKTARIEGESYGVITTRNGRNWIAPVARLRSKPPAAARRIQTNLFRHICPAPPTYGAYPTPGAYVHV